MKKAFTPFKATPSLPHQITSSDAIKQINFVNQKHKNSNQRGLKLKPKMVKYLLFVPCISGFSLLYACSSMAVRTENGSQSHITASLPNLPAEQKALSIDKEMDQIQSVLEDKAIKQAPQQDLGGGAEKPLFIEKNVPEDIDTANDKDAADLTEATTDDREDAADYSEDSEEASEEQVQENLEQNPPEPIDSKPTTDQILEKVVPSQPTFSNTDDPYVQEVNASTWYKGMKVNPYTTVKLQILLDWNHASPGPIDKGWGMNSKKALRAFEFMHGFKVDGRMDEEVWAKLTEGDMSTREALVNYTITKADVKGPYQYTPRGYEAKSKMHHLAYQNIQEMLGERFHMNVNFLRQLNPESKFKAGDTIIVVNVGKHNNSPINRVIADKRSEMLYAYYGDKLVATYPTTVGSSKTPSPNGTHSVVAKVYMPFYGATSKSDPKKKWTLPPGPNNPVGTVWLALSKPSYGIHGSPKPEGISRQASAGCVRLTNWDAAELYSTIEKGAKVEFR